MALLNLGKCLVEAEAAPLLSGLLGGAWHVGKGATEVPADSSSKPSAGHHAHEDLRG